MLKLWVISASCVLSSMFIGSTDFIDISEYAWQVYNGTNTSSNATGNTEVSETNDTSPIEEEEVSNSNTDDENSEDISWYQRVWSAFSTIGKDSKKPEADTEISSEGWSLFTSVPPAPCEWLYLIPYHNWTLSGLYHQVKEIYPGGGGNGTAEESLETETPVNQQPGEEEEERRRGFPPRIVLIQALAFLLTQYMTMLLLTCVCVCWIRRRKRNDLKLRENERILQEKLEREAAARNEEGERLLDLGSRLQKYWFKYEDMIFTKAPVAKNCFLDLTTHQDPLNEFIHNEINILPYIQPIYSIQHKCEGERKELKIAQPFHQQGSLRDIIHKEDPTKDWSQKYLKDGTPLPSDKVARYGWQILKGMTSLYLLSYADISLCPLEHVHVGNIFVEEDTCMLGGFENKLLGYRPRLYRTILEEGKLPFIDVITFGHVVYEMASGRELRTLTPREEGEVDDYAGMEQSCVEILRYIFTLKHKVKRIKSHEFFAGKKPLIEMEQIKYGLYKTISKPKEKLDQINEYRKKYYTQTARRQQQQRHSIVISGPLYTPPAPSGGASYISAPFTPTHVPPESSSQEAALPSSESQVMAAKPWDLSGCFLAFCLIVFLMLAIYLIVVLLVIFF